MRQARPAARFDQTPADLRSAAPLLGEHTDQVLSELGVSQEEIASLREASAVA
jgi:benzylsuccinate CoA-transferase BbsF subunit